jgi:hypothetical protein
LIGNGTSKIVVAQVQNGEVEQPRYICWNCPRDIVVVEEEILKVLEHSRV